MRLVDPLPSWTEKPDGGESPHTTGTLQALSRRGLLDGLRRADACQISVNVALCAHAGAGAADTMKR